jgi:hypothetical protein
MCGKQRTYSNQGPAKTRQNAVLVRKYGFCRDLVLNQPIKAKCQQDAGSHGRIEIYLKGTIFERLVPVKKKSKSGGRGTGGHDERA